MKRPLELLTTACGSKKARISVDLSRFANKPWYHRLHAALGVDPQLLPCIGVFEFFETDERVGSQKEWTPGYPLDLIENPALQFCIAKKGVMQKLVLDADSIFHGTHVKGLDLVTRKVQRVDWMYLSRYGFTCNYYCDVKHVSWKVAGKAFMHLLREGHLCHVEYFDTADYTALAQLLTKGMQRIAEVVQEEFAPPRQECKELTECEDDASQTTQLISDVEEDGTDGASARGALECELQQELVKRLQMGAYKSVRGYYRELYHPGYHSFTDADEWAQLNGGAKAAPQCLVTLRATCIRAITVANTKYILTD